VLPCEQARIGKRAKTVRFADSVAYVDGLSKLLSASVGSASATCTVVVRIASADSAQNMHARLTLRTCNAAKFSRGSSQSRKSSRMPVCVFSKGRTKQGILRPEMRPNSSAAVECRTKRGVQSILIFSSTDCHHKKAWQARLRAATRASHIRSTAQRATAAVVLLSCYPRAWHPWPTLTTLRPCLRLMNELRFLKFRLISRIYRPKMVRGRIIVRP
jgi:hypothetical protein